MTDAPTNRQTQGGQTSIGTDTLQQKVHSFNATMPQQLRPTKLCPDYDVQTMSSLEFTKTGLALGERHFRQRKNSLREGESERERKPFNNNPCPTEPFKRKPPYCNSNMPQLFTLTRLHGLAEFTPSKQALTLHDFRRADCERHLRAFQKFGCSGFVFTTSLQLQCGSLPHPKKALPEAHFPRIDVLFIQTSFRLPSDFLQTVQASFLHPRTTPASS